MPDGQNGNPGWDLKKFSEAFVDRTKKNIVGMKQNWTKEMESAVRQAIPGRWHDVSQVLQQAESLMKAALRPVGGQD